MVFVLFNQLNKSIYYYENKYQNKKDIPLNIYYSEKYNKELNILSFCEKYIVNKYIKNSKSTLILTDSKETTEILKQIFIKHNSKEDYYRVFNREEGTLQDMIDINKVGVNRCLIASPRWCYGLDLLIDYEEIFVIYSYTSGLQSMGAFEMIQQISRARNTKCVNLLCLDPTAKYVFNQFISYEENQKNQDKYINGYSKIHGDLCKKYDVINEMGCTMIDVNGKIKFNNDSFMTKIHYLKTWYDQLFHKNKVDIIKLIAKDYGYKITETNYNPNCAFLNSLKNSIKLQKEEIIEVSKKILLCEKIDDKYFVDNLREQVKMREKYLQNINDNDKLCELVSEHTKFINYINIKYFDLTKTEFEKKSIELVNNDILQMSKDNDIVNKINVCFWFEELLKINRLEIENLGNADLKNIKKIFNENTEKFYYIFRTMNVKIKLLNQLNIKLNQLKCKLFIKICC